MTTAPVQAPAPARPWMTAAIDPRYLIVLLITLVLVVGEASYTVAPNGNGEFGITIAHPWQGWLGPFLLDALVEAAAAHGIPELEADVMRENRKMLALVRSRGFVIRGRPDHGIMRIAIAAARPLSG